MSLVTRKVPNSVQLNLINYFCSLTALNLHLNSPPAQLRSDLTFLIDEKTDLINWSYTQACALLRRNYDILDELTETLSSGSATVGDCVACIENME